MEFIGKYHWAVYEIADHRTRDWPPLGDFIPIFSIILGYLYIIKIGGPNYMKNRKPYEIKRAIQIYNVFQIVSCTLIIKGIYNNISTTDLISINLPDRSNNYHAVQLAKVTWWIVVLKVIEMVETVFFILKKKFNQASLLHTHHHVATLLLTWVLANYYPGGAAMFPIYINTYIHFIMYTYYLLSTFGPKWQNKLAKWKNKLTILQMIQFTIMLIHASQVFITWPLREIPMAVYLIFFPNVIFVFKNFYDFYDRTYSKNS